MPGKADEVFQIRTLVKRINALSPAGRAYLLQRLQEEPAPEAPAASTPEPA